MTINELLKNFNTRAQWSLFGSIGYEFLRISHNAVLAMLFCPQAFGLIGSIFASTYLVVRLCDVGATNSLLPFFGYLDQSKQQFKAFFIKKLLLSLVISATLGATIAGVLLRLIRGDSFFTSYYIIIIPLLIFSETLRSFLRQFLHLIGLSKKTVIADHGVFCLYIVTSWPILFFYPNLRHPELVFSLFLMDSLIGVLLLSRFTYFYAKKLPDYLGKQIELPAPKALFLSRFYAWILRICKELFSSNALTPLFAATVGLKEAGLFYFAATLAMALHAIMRSVIGFAGASFFVHARRINMSAQESFKIVSRKLSNIIIVLAFFFTFVYQDILKLTRTAAVSSKLTLFFIMYFSIIILEFSLFLYEQQYQIEQAGAKALQWRFFEFAIVFTATQGFISIQPIPILLCILLAKTITLLALALTGYRQWSLKPSIQIDLKKTIFLFILSLCLAGGLKSIIYAFNLL